MEYRDYYQVLGVARNASEKEIKRAYRRLARQYHPDRNPGSKAAEEQFKAVNEAHEVLTDPDKRSKYDRLGAQWQQWQQMGGDPRDFDFSHWFARGPQQTRVEYGNLDDLLGGMGGFSDFFRSVFGEAKAQPTMNWRQAQHRTQRGQDYEQLVEISLEEAYHGTSRTLEVEGNRLEVKIPPGVGSGSKVRVVGKGGRSAAGAPAGDIYLKIIVSPHGAFERKGNDLYCEIPVDLYTALLGGEVHILTFKGEVLLKLPPETQAGRSFRLRGRGMPNLHHPDQYGDLLAKVKVVLPEQLSERERALFQELAAYRRPGIAGKP